MFKIKKFSAFDVLKITTLTLLSGLLVFLGSAKGSTSLFAYVALSTIVMLQIIEVLCPHFSAYRPNQRSRIIFPVMGLILSGCS